MCGVVVIVVENLSKFFGCSGVVGLLDFGVYQSYGTFCLECEVGPCRSSWFAITNVYN